MIQADRLTKWFENLAAVDGVSFYVPAGQILILLGPNGAGKTTTIRMLTSILRPTSGSALINGFDVVKDATKVRKLVGVLTEHHGLYGRMSAVEYLDFYGQLYGLERITRQHRTDQLLDQFGLSQAKYKRLGEYSKGMRQKLARLSHLVTTWPVFDFHPVFAIWGHNVLALTIALVLGILSFGILGVLPSIATFSILGYLLQYFVNSGIPAWQYLVGFILPHGMIEIPAAILAGAAVLQMGAILATPTPGKTIGEVWLNCLADWVKVMLGAVIPLLLLSAVIEAWITPRVALWLIH